MIKLLQGKAQRFFWMAPAPVLSTNTPSVTIKLNSGDFTSDLTPVRSTADEITAVSADGRRIQMATDVSDDVQGIVGPRLGSAFLKLEGKGHHFVRVVRVSGNVAYLAQALPEICGGAPAGSSLQWVMYHVEVPALNLADAEPAVKWEVSWQRSDGADSPTTTEADQGVLRVVRQIFRTGLDMSTLYGFFPWLMDQGFPRGQTSWQPQIDAALAMMLPVAEAKLRQMRPTAYIDDVYGSPFLVAHAEFFNALILKSQVLQGAADPDDAAKAMIMAMQTLEGVLAAPLWVDLDGDGVADSGEIEDNASQAVTGGLYSDDTLFGDDGTFTAQTFKMDDQR